MFIRSMASASLNASVAAPIFFILRASPEAPKSLADFISSEEICSGVSSLSKRTDNASLSPRDFACIKSLIFKLALFFLTL